MYKSNNEIYSILIKVFGLAVLIHLSEALDCIPHDVLIAKLHAYVFGKKTVTFINSYLKRRKQNDSEPRQISSHVAREKK